MKRKLFLTIVCLLLALLCLVGCADYSKQFEKINKLLNAEYSAMSLTVTVTKDLDEFVSEFNVTYGNNDTSSVDFVVRRLATFDNSDTLPDSFINTYKGSATVKGGQVTSVSGDVPQDVKLEAVVGRGLTFHKNYFSDVNEKGSYLTAKVTKPQAFFGDSDFTCKPDTMIVTVGYGDLIDYVRIQYTSNSGSKVVLMYSFVPPQI
ncbi:MAG: hypothetical protein NC132_05900 [Corallococcus sp.]|nr:hypothetical protein [Corallococcus sp.]MCM1360063.1 hypothetical protein [Corallococcus sp.]MCM1395620.1 hypothetical protein [Corallococcus sp.]